MKSRKRDNRSAPRERASFAGIMRQLVGMAASALPYVLAVDALGLVLARFLPAVRAWVNWPVLHGGTALLAALVIFGRPDAFTTRLKRARGVFAALGRDAFRAAAAVRNQVGRTTRTGWLKGLFAAGLLLWAVLGGADILGAIVLAFALAVIVYRRWEGDLPFRIGMILLILTPLFQAAGFEQLSPATAVYAAELLGIAAAAWMTEAFLKTGDK